MEKAGGRPSSQSTMASTPSSRIAVPLPRLSTLPPAPSSPASFRTVGHMFSWSLLLLVPRLGTLLPFRNLVPFPEERDKKGITGTLSLFNPVSLRAFVRFKTCNPLAHVFHSI